MAVDAHCHLDPELPLDRLVSAMDAGGIDRAALIPAAQAPIGRVGAAGPAIFRACMEVPALRMPIYRIARRSGGLEPHLQPDNDGVLAAARARPDRFLPFSFVNPALGDGALDELDRTTALGAVGVKLHLWFHGYRLPDAVPVLRRAAAKGMPVLAHLGFGPAEDVATVMDAVPGLKLILAHAGMPHFERLWGLERVWFDVAAPQLVGKRMRERLVNAVGPAHVIYGSDAPVGIRDGKGYRYALPPLPDRAIGANLESLLG